MNIIKNNKEYKRSYTVNVHLTTEYPECKFIENMFVLRSNIYTEHTRRQRENKCSSVYTA